MSNKTVQTQTQSQEVAVVSTEILTDYLSSQGLNKNLTKEETTQFLEICKAYQLNPFKREIYATKYGTNFSIIVGYEVYLKRAERSNDLSGWNVKFEGSVKESDLRAIITIYRRSWDKPLVHDVWYDEYVQTTKDGTPNKFWREKPRTMLRKVAISQGFRLAFPDELGGIPYTREELNDIEPQDIPYTEHEAAKMLKPELLPNSDAWAKAVVYYRNHKDKGIAMNSILDKYDISKQNKPQLIFEAEQSQS